jgi:hypothetical protein
LVHEIACEPFQRVSFEAVPGCETSKLVMKLQAWVWNFKPGCETSNLGVKLQTWVWNFKPGCETSNLGVKLQNWLWNFKPGVNLKPGYEIYNYNTSALVGFSNFKSRENILVIALKIFTTLAL